MVSKDESLGVVLLFKTACSEMAEGLLATRTRPRPGPGPCRVVLDLALQVPLRSPPTPTLVQPALASRLAPVLFPVLPEAPFTD
jgi:hypothetical protein